jgi:hypothetical protein
VDSAHAAKFLRGDGGVHDRAHGARSRIRASDTGGVGGRRQWFASDDSVWLYSFVAICDVVGLDPTYVRAGLGLWTDMQRTQPAETAPLSYRFPFRRMNGTRHRTNARATGMARDPRGLIQTRQGT